MPIRVITLALALCLSVFGQGFGSSSQAKTAPVSTTVSIPLNASVMATGVDLQGCTPAAIEMPSAWTAADIAVSAAKSYSGTYNTVYDQYGSQLIVSAAASRFIILSPADWWSFRYIKLHSVTVGTPGTPVAQTAARTITIHCR